MSIVRPSCSIAAPYGRGAGSIERNTSTKVRAFGEHFAIAAEEGISDVSFQAPRDVVSRRTKTQAVCTIGKASYSKAALADLLEAGMSVARLNFSHGSYEMYAQVAKNLRSCCMEMGLQCALLMDTRGPEIRIGEFANGSGEYLTKGHRFMFCAYHVLGDENRVTIRSWSLWNHVQPGDRIVLDYGVVAFTIEEVRAREIITRVENSNFVGQRKHLVVQTNQREEGIENFRTSLLSYKDTEDIAFALAHNFDLIAISYSASGADIEEVRSLPGVRESGVKLLAKVDTSAAVCNIRELLQASDGLVICRSQIALHLPVEQLSTLQKRIIRQAKIASKPVVVINHILFTMQANPTCTRSEASDVANIILDGADALALTNPTAEGSYGVEAVRTMLSIAHEAEAVVDYRSRYVRARNNWLRALDADDNQPAGAPRQLEESMRHVHSLASTAVKIAWDVLSPVIVVFTDSGRAATVLSSYSPHCVVIAVTSHEIVARQLQIVHGIRPFLVGSLARVDNVLEHVISELRNEGLLFPGEIVTHTSGSLENATDNEHRVACYQV